MPDNSEVIGKKTLYIQLFKIYEKELLSIFEHIHPSGENLKSYGNRIHELHLRICSEIENIAKEVCYSIQPKQEVEEIMKNKRYEEFRQGLKSIQCEDENVINYIMNKSKFSPFSHYLDFLDEHLSICSKKIEKVFGVELFDFYSKEFVPDFYQPFGRVGPGNVPSWRSNYNGIKHRKLETYDKCTLGDLISSFGGYFILLNYLFFGYNSTISNNGYMVNDILEYIKGGTNIKSKVFIPTCAFIQYPMNLLVSPSEQRINENLVQNVDTITTEKTNELNIVKFGNKQLDNINEYMYYCCLKLVPTIGVSDLNMDFSSQELYKLRPFVLFTNNGIEKITTSKIGINIEEGETYYDIEIGYPSDYRKTIIVVGDDKKNN